MASGRHPVQRHLGILINQVNGAVCTYMPSGRQKERISHVCLEEISRKQIPTGFYCCAQLDNISKAERGIFFFLHIFAELHSYV